MNLEYSKIIKRIQSQTKKSIVKSTIDKRNKEFLKLKRHLSKLKRSTFDNWSEEKISGYITSILNIEEFIKTKKVVIEKTNFKDEINDRLIFNGDVYYIGNKTYIVKKIKNIFYLVNQEKNENNILSDFLKKDFNNFPLTYLGNKLVN